MTLTLIFEGSLRGYDWTSLAMDVAPYSDITYSMRKNMWEKVAILRHIYDITLNYFTP